MRTLHDCKDYVNLDMVGFSRGEEVSGVVPPISHVTHWAVYVPKTKDVMDFGTTTNTAKVQSPLTQGGYDRCTAGSWGLGMFISLCVFSAQSMIFPKFSGKDCQR